MCELDVCVVVFVFFFFKQKTAYEMRISDWSSDVCSSDLLSGMTDLMVDAPPSGARYPSLAGKRVIVSGGGSGIGEGIVEGFARQGAAVAFVDIQTAPSEALVARLADAPIPPRFAPCDITDLGAYAACLDHLIAQLGGWAHLVKIGRAHV